MQQDTRGRYPRTGTATTAVVGDTAGRTAPDRADSPPDPAPQGRGAAQYRIGWHRAIEADVWHAVTHGGAYLSATPSGHGWVPGIRWPGTPRTVSGPAQATYTLAQQWARAHADADADMVPVTTPDTASRSDTASDSRPDMASRSDAASDSHGGTASVPVSTPQPRRHRGGDDTTAATPPAVAAHHARTGAAPSRPGRITPYRYPPTPRRTGSTVGVPVPVRRPGDAPPPIRCGRSPGAGASPPLAPVIPLHPRRPHPQ